MPLVDPELSEIEGSRGLRQIVCSMFGVLALLAAAGSSVLKSRASLQLENLALRRRIGVPRCSARKPPKLAAAGWIFWAWLCRVCSGSRSALAIVKPETVIAWRRKGLRLFWTRKVRHGQPGRPSVSNDDSELIRQVSWDNSIWPNKSSVVRSRDGQHRPDPAVWQSSNVCGGRPARGAGHPRLRLCRPTGARFHGTGPGDAEVERTAAQRAPIREEWPSLPRVNRSPWMAEA